MITELFELVLSRLPGLTILLMVLILARRWVLGLLNARVAYAMWLIIPVFLFFPFDWLVSNSYPIEGMFTYRYNPLNTEYQSLKTQFSSSQLFWLSTIWAIGCATYFTLYLLKYLAIKDSFKPHHSIQNNFGSKNLSTVQSSIIDFPAVIGCINAYLILPKSFSNLDAKKQTMIITHELCHLRRQDYRWNIFRVILRGIFWFHPLVHLADKYIEADQEISCDLMVLENASQGERYQYGETLIESAAHGRSVLLSQWDCFSLTKERVKMLKKYQQKQWHGAVALVFASLALWFTGNFAMANSGKGEEIKPLSIVQPRYPLEAAKSGIEGFVRFQMDVDTDGKPLNIKIVESTPDDTFSEVALTAIEQWRFDVKQAQRNVNYTMSFVLE